jgi:hypothetical protein
MQKVFYLFVLTSSIAFADPTTIINNNNSGTTPYAGCGNNTNNGPYVPPGTYKQADGSINYTTGNKQPYIVDNCNNTPVQPYVYAQPPANGIMPGPVGNRPVERMNGPGIRR